MRVNKLIIALILLFISFDLISTSIILRILPISFFLIVLGDEILNTGKILKFYDKRYRFLLAFMLIVALGVLSSTRQGVTFLYKSFKAITFVFFLITFLTFIQNRLDKDMVKLFFKLVYLPLLVYISVNLSLFFVGIENNEEPIIGTAVMLSYLGISHARVEFPLSIGVNAYGSLLGAALTLSLLGYFVINKYKKYFLVGIVVSFISLLYTDSRGPMFYSILILLVVKFYNYKKHPPKFLWLIPLLTFFGPILLLAALEIVSSFSIADSISRTSGDLATGNSRSVIWGIALSEFFKFDLDYHLFGYGEFGHYSAGLSQIWGPIVFGVNNKAAKFMHPHNSLLSIALDYGYLGVLVFTVIQYKIVSFVRSNWYMHREISIFILGNILYYNLVGIGETMIAFYYQNVLYLFFMVNAFVFVMKDKVINKAEN